MATAKQTSRKKATVRNAVTRRRVESAAEIMTNPAEVRDDNILYRHGALCQTFLPYRKPEEGVTYYERQNGDLSLIIQATQVKSPDGDPVYLGLPYGPKARLAMMHIDTLAIQQQKPNIDVQDSMTKFVTEQLGLSNSGRNIRDVKEQLARLGASMISVAMVNREERRTKQFDTKVIAGFDLWFPKDDSQRVLWDSTIVLNDVYFNNLMEHAVPHDMRMVAALSNNSMALDVLSWLTHRLHRVPFQRPHFVTWKQLKDQFGTNYRRMADFKRDFRKVLKEVLLQYRDARIEEVDNQGFHLFHSKPPVPYSPPRRLTS